jgi:F-type H+-transporting ATPase subunit a
MLHRFFRQPLLLLSFFGLLAFGGFAGAAQAAEPAAVAEKHEVLSLKPVVLLPIGKFAITNSMLVTWIVAVGIILFAQAATRKIKAVPDGAQNFWEWLVESLYNFLESIIGRDLVRKTFWFFATLFIFILFVNWFGLIPGVGTIGWGHHDPVTNRFLVDRPLFRGGNADLNMTWLEIISILFRPISLSFRLFGNVYAGESILEAMSNMVPMLSWLIPIPFYFLEVLVGIVQALVFMLLTAIFTLLIAQHGPGETAH